MPNCGPGVIVERSDNWCKLYEPGCGRRGCENCAPLRISRIKRRFRDGDPNKFFTITLPKGAYETQQQRVDVLHAALRALKKEMHKRHPLWEFEYGWCIELQTNGMPHAHVLARAKYMPQAWLSKFLVAHGCGPITDIRAVHSAKKRARYVAKYCAKADEFVDGRRAFGLSKGYTIPVWLERQLRRADGVTASLSRKAMTEVAADLCAQGFRIEWLSPSEATAIRVVDSPPPKSRWWN